MAKFRSSPESGFITRLLGGIDANFEVVVRQPWDGEVWNLSAKDEGSMTDYRNGPWGFVVDRRAGEMIKRTEIFVCGVESSTQGYLEVNNVIDARGDTKFYLDES